MAAQRYHAHMTAVYHWLWRLLPGNPMLVRIVQGGSRRLRHLWARMAYLGALIILVLVGLLSGGGMGSEINLNDLAKAGTRVFAIVSYGQVILVCLLAPVFMAAAIASEQSGKTYNILLTTPLSNLQIVLGSLFGRLFFVLALLLSGLPLFAVLLIFGGVPVRSVFLAFAVAGFTALLVGSVAVTLSVFRAAGRKAVFVFVISVAGYLVAAQVADVVVLRQAGQTTWLTPLHPLLVLEASLNNVGYRPPQPETLADRSALVRGYLTRPFATFAVLSSAASLALVLLCALVLRRVGAGEGLLWTWLKKKLRLGSEGRRQRKAREVRGNPIAWREAHTRGKLAAGILGRWAFTVLALVAAIAVTVLYHHSSLPQRVDPNTGQALVTQAQVFRGIIMTLLMAELAVIVLVAIYMAAGCVSREREDGTLDLILTTPITPQQYIWGKLRGLVSFLALMIAAPLLTAATVALYTALGALRDWPQARASYVFLQVTGNYELFLIEAPILMLLVLLPFVALCVMVGMSCSLKAKGVIGAVLPAVGIIGALSLVAGFCGMRAAETVPLVGPALNALSPATNLLMIVNPWETTAGFLEDPLTGRISLTLSALLAAGTYSLIVFVILRSIVSSFDQTVRRLTGIA